MTREERLIRAIWQEDDKNITLTEQGEAEILAQILSTNTILVTPKVSNKNSSHIKSTNSIKKGN